MGEWGSAAHGEARRVVYHEGLYVDLVPGPEYVQCGGAAECVAAVCLSARLATETTFVGLTAEQAGRVSWLGLVVFGRVVREWWAPCYELGCAFSQFGC